MPTGKLPPFSAYLLSHDKVVNYLIEAKNNGWCERAYEDGTNRFVILLPGDKRIHVYLEYGLKWSVEVELKGFWATWGGVVGNADSMLELEKLLSRAARKHSTRWPERKTTARLRADTPATNLATIAGLVGATEVQAVFDPYLDNSALSALLNILSFGAQVSNSVRLLSCEKMAKPNNPRLTRSYVEDWFKERGIGAGEARVMPDGEHRRFILLSGGRSLILGMSLNSISKNEAIRLELDAADRAFFDGAWAAARPLS